LTKKIVWTILFQVTAGGGGGDKKEMMKKCHDGEINIEAAFKGMDDCKKKEEENTDASRRRRSPGGGGKGGKGGKRNMVKWDDLKKSFVFQF